MVARIARDGGLDEDDLREIATDFCLKKRETDVMGYLSDGVVAFLLPYSGSAAAAAFSKSIIERIDMPAVSVNYATYTDAHFDDFVRQSLLGSEGVPRFVDHAASKRGRGTLAIKRIIDVVGALALMTVFSPLMALTAAAVKLTSDGPVIFRQNRIGRNGVPFAFYKFRSMRVGGNDQVHRDYVSKLIEGKHAEINEGDGRNPIYKLKSDSRITPIGRVIRRTSIDELPQLFNVLKGEMSLVGPRPPIPYEVEKYQSWHLRRLQEVRPGITGLWQVEGRSKTSFDEMVRLDLRYVRNWSLWLDLQILLKTIVVVVRRDGAD